MSVIATVRHGWLYYHRYSTHPRPIKYHWDISDSSWMQMSINKYNHFVMFRYEGMLSKNYQIGDCFFLLLFCVTFLSIHILIFFIVNIINKFRWVYVFVQSQFFSLIQVSNLYTKRCKNWQTINNLNVRKGLSLN